MFKKGDVNVLSLSVGESEIFMENGFIKQCGDFFSKFFSKCKVLLISDSNVFDIYSSDIIDCLKKLKFDVKCYVIKSGEESKSLKTVEKIYNVLKMCNMSRSDIILGVGGGVVTDISGFVASTYNRGMNFVSIPTSLLAMVDAAIGGKNGVNFYGKNLVGTFYDPRFVLIDPFALNTLPKMEFYSGMAEVIKCAAVKSKDLFEMIDKKIFFNNLTEIIYQTILIKKHIVESDKFDKSLRMLLNFGHTFGHAIELSDSTKKISHGFAVSIGMNLITKIFEKLGKTDKGVSTKLSEICKKYNLPIKSDVSIEKIISLAMSDKKVVNNTFNLIGIKNIGECFVYKLPKDHIEKFMKGDI